MISKDFFQALEDFETERRIKKEVFLDALETALTSAYKKNFGEAKSAVVKLNPEKCKIEVYSYKTVVEKPEEVVDADKQILLEDAQKIKKTYKVGDIIQQEENPKDFGRIAVQTAKQVVMQKLREIQHEQTINEISEKEDELVTTVINRIDGENIFVEIGSNQLEAVMGIKDQIPGERYYVGQHIKVYVKKIKDGIKGPMLQVSRANVGFIKKLFELEIPEITSGDVIINSISREAGYRTKIAVSTPNENIDPIGACVGDKGSRINTIITELNGEKIDIIEYSDDISTFIARSLSPAMVENVQIIGEGQAVAYVPDDKLSLAIGRSGQNVRLAARLTHYRIDVKSQSTMQNTDTQKEKEPTIPTPQVEQSIGLDEMFKEKKKKK